MVDAQKDFAAEFRTPLVWCTVKLSEVISSGLRLDVESYGIEARNAHRRLMSGKYAPVFICGNNGLASAYVCGRFKRIWVEKSDYPIYQPSSIADLNPVPDGYISYNTRTNIEKLRLRKGQVLLSCSGNVGKTAYVSKTLDGLIFSHDLIRIECINPDDAGYLYAYFKSDVGSKVVASNTYGTVITHIEPEHLEKVPIPDAPIELKKKVNDLVVKSYELRDESNDLLDEANRLLIQELELPPLEKMKANTADKAEMFTIRLSQSDLRFDVSYHLPVVYDVIDHLKRYSAELTTVGDERISTRVLLPGRFKRSYVEKGMGRIFIGGKQIGQLDPQDKKYLSLSRHEKRISRELMLSENMTLITRSGTIGQLALVSKHWENWIASEHLIRVIPANENVAGYLNVFLASQWGRLLIERNTYGSVVDEITDEQVKNIPFPLLKNHDIQRKINDLALQANAKRYEAYLMEKDAINVIDEEVLAQN